MVRKESAELHHAKHLSSALRALMLKVWMQSRLSEGAVIDDYHNHFFDSLIALQKLRDVAGDMQNEEERRRQLGFTEEEEAFYEILTRHKTAVSDFEIIKDLVKEITASIKKNLQIDWYKKPDARAQIILTVKRALMRKGVSQELQDILNEIMEQAEARYKEWWGEESVA